jgi:hypothetical protein
LGSGGDDLDTSDLQAALTGVTTGIESEEQTKTTTRLGP